MATRSRAGTVATASVATAFRAPDSTDRFGPGGNPRLRPETARSYEIGLRGHHAHRHWSVNLFDTRIDDLVAFVPDPATMEFRAANVDRARIRGLEAAAGLQVGPWRLDLQAVLENPQDRASGNAAPATRATHRRRHAAL